MLIRKTFGRLRTLSRSVTTGQVESQQLDEEYLSAKSYETIPKVSSLKILWSMMDSKEKTRLDKVIKGYHDTAGKEWSTAGLRDLQEYTIIGRHAWKESIIGGIIILLTPAPIIDSFPVWKPPLCHKEPMKGKISLY